MVAPATKADHAGATAGADVLGRLRIITGFTFEAAHRTVDLFALLVCAMQQLRRRWAWGVIWMVKALPWWRGNSTPRLPQGGLPVRLVMRQGEDKAAVARWSGSYGLSILHPLTRPLGSRRSRVCRLGRLPPDGARAYEVTTTHSAFLAMRAAATCTSFCAAGRRLTSANTSRIFLARCSSVSGFEASSRSPLVATKPIVLPGKQAVHGVGPLRSLPRWDRTDSSALLSSTSTKRWIEGKERRYTEFGSSKQWKTLSIGGNGPHLLRRRDLEGLPFVAKYNVYGETGEHTGPPRLTRFYVVYDVQDRALRRWGSAAAMNDEHERRRQVRERRRARLQPPALMLLRPVRVRKGQVVVGSRVVFAAIVGNCGVVVAKLAGWGVSGSGSMLSEAFHSMADLGNQVMLAIGLQQSMRRPDVSRPYGYGYEQYVWAMISGVSTFILGAGASVYHGVQLLLNPTELESLPTAVAVLGFETVGLHALRRVPESA